ncbi:MAG TPA: homoserine kinase [Methylomirabilota bacterium]
MRVRVIVPASSANFGPGFDVLAIALALHNVAELAEADGLTVEVEGEGAASLPRDDRNVVVRGARLVYEAAGRHFRGLAVRQRNRIPPGRGLGSSASAWLAGILGANALLGDPLGPDAMMELAVGQEGHPDNLGASLHGGLAVTCWDGETRAVVSVPVPAGAEFAVLVPDFEASTAAARAALPVSYSRPDAVYNLARAALLVAGWSQARWDLVGQAMSDRMHQPYRARAMFPWLDGVLAAARGAGALGAALSGAGPSVLGLAPPGKGATVARAMTAALASAGHSGQGHVLDADARGAQVERLP